MRFICVNDSTPEQTTGTLRTACKVRGIEYLEIAPAQFDFMPERQLVPGDMLYRPAISLSAQRVEHFLYGPGVATFHRDPDGMYFVCSNQPLRFQRANIPIPRSVYATTANQAILDSQVEFLGGLPVIVKFHGHSSGIGVFKADSMHTVYSIVGYAIAQSISPMILSYVGDATHWRVVVIGEDAVAAYRNPLDGDDFRTFGGVEKCDFAESVAPELADIAIRAVHSVRLDFGGVDILEHESGRLFVLESNYPCYHAHAEEHGGVDVSGRMIDYLKNKSLCLVAEIDDGD